MTQILVLAALWLVGTLALVFMFIGIDFVGSASQPRAAVIMALLLEIGTACLYLGYWGLVGMARRAILGT